MKVRFLKDHLRHKAGTEAEVVDARGNYYIQCNVAVAVESAKEAEVTTATKKKAATKKAKGK